MTLELKAMLVACPAPPALHSVKESPGIHCTGRSAAGKYIWSRKHVNPADSRTTIPRSWVVYAVGRVLEY